MKTTERRQSLREALIAVAERSIDAHGLAGLKARELAAEAGCAVGAIYNVVADLDDLVLAVNARTLTMLEAELVAAALPPPGGVDGNDGADGATAQLVRMALGYLRFAAAHTRRWRAVFDHRLPDGKELPDWYRGQQQRLFAFVEQPLQVLQPDLAHEQFELLARSLFSAVHGIVMLGLEEKLGAVSLADLEAQTTAILTALGVGFSAHGRLEDPM